MNPTTDSTHLPEEARGHFNLVWPCVARFEIPRTCLYIRKGMAWQPMYLDAFTTSVTIDTNDTSAPIIYIHNAYNSLIIGDFNAHNHVWSRPGRWSRHAGEKLRTLIESRPLHVVTPRGLVIRPSRMGDAQATPSNDTNTNTDTGTPTALPPRPAAATLTDNPGTNQPEPPAPGHPDTDNGDNELNSGGPRMSGSTIDLPLASWDLKDQARTPLRRPEGPGD